MKRPTDGRLRAVVKQVMALKLAGHTRAQMAPILGLTPGTIVQYLSIAGKRGLIAKADQTDPRERIDHVMMHTVLDKLDAAIHSSDPDRSQTMAFKIAQETIFKSYDHDKTPAAPPTNVLAIKIETTGSAAPLREGSVGGAPRYLDGETDE